MVYRLYQKRRWTLIIKKLSFTADRIIDELNKCGITHIVWLPDQENQFVSEALKNQPAFTMVPVCREGEAIAIATGLMLGGKKPVVWHQSTGFFESGDSVRGLALDLKLPLLLLIDYRGWRQDTPPTDSAAIFIEPILDAWGIKHYLVTSDENAERISLGFNEANRLQKPVAVLIGREME